MSKTYYVVISRDKREIESPWSQEFGDYSRAVAKQELVDLKYSTDMEARGRIEYKLITCGDSQPEIDAAIAKLNNVGV